MAAILERGHEVATTGYMHAATDPLDDAGQRAELERGLEALDRYGVRPAGYRSPGWELTPETLAVLAKLGFRYDSSLMADDRPYWETSGGEPAARAARALEPVRLAAVRVHARSTADCWPSQDLVERVWLDEYESARRGPARAFTLHDAPGGHRPRLPDQDARPGDHR